MRSITTLPDEVGTVIVGAGHCGLAMSGMLSEAGQEHLVLEARESPGGSWRDRWDSFTLVTPNWVSSLPGWTYDGPDHDGFMGRDRIAERITQYADVIDAPVAVSAGVHRLSRDDKGFRLQTARGEVRAGRVVVTTGSYHRPRVPDWAAAITPRVVQLHSHEYRNPGALPPGGVLVVGTGQSGVQLADELFAAGRRVYLSVGRAGQAPRRYRGKDFFQWLVELEEHGRDHGIDSPTADTLPDPALRFAADPFILERGGADRDLRHFAADGIQLAGRLASGKGERVTFAADLAFGLAFADRWFDDNLKGPIDAYIARSGLAAPPDGRRPFRYEPVPVLELDLAEADVSTVIWATGYSLDFGWIDLPIFEAERGYPRNHRGLSEVPGLSFLGLLWQRSEGSATLAGPGLDGPYLLERMTVGARA